MPIGADGFFNMYMEKIKAQAEMDAALRAEYTTYKERPRWQQRLAWLVKKWQQPIEIIDWDAIANTPIKVYWVDTLP